MGSEVTPPKFYNLYLKFRRDSTESLYKYCHCFNFQKVWCGQYYIGAGRQLPKSHMVATALQKIINTIDTLYSSLIDVNISTF